MGTERGPNASLLPSREHFFGKERGGMTDPVDLGGTFSLRLRKRRSVTLSIGLWVRPFIFGITQLFGKMRKLRLRERKTINPVKSRASVQVSVSFFFSKLKKNKKQKTKIVL